MSLTRALMRSTTLRIVFSVATVALVSGKANAQYSGYGWGYEFPDPGFEGTPGAFDYGATGLDYGMSDFAYPGAATGFNYGAGGVDYGLSAVGLPSYPYGGGQDYGYVETGTGFPYVNSLSGVGTTAVGDQGLVNDSNRTGRRQTAAQRRATARRLRLQQQGR